MVEAGIHAVLEGEALAGGESAKKLRHVVEGDESLGANLERIGRVVCAHQAVDAARSLERPRDSRIDRVRHGPAPYDGGVAPRASVGALAVVLVPRFDEAGESVEKAASADGAEGETESLAKERMPETSFQSLGPVLHKFYENIRRRT